MLDSLFNIFIWLLLLELIVFGVTTLIFMVISILEVIIEFVDSIKYKR